MELIEILETRQEKNGKWKKWAKFKCPFCLQVVEKRLSNGLICKSCGCKRKELIGNFQKGKIVSLITILNMSNAQKGRIIYEKTKQKMKENHADFSGKNNPNWQNGKSFEEYGITFNKELKQQVLERDNYECQNPNCLIDNPKRLDCHHIDYNKKNNLDENLITLCISCHMKTNTNNKRYYYTEFYQNIIMEKYR